jgi:hypothetical protein
MEGKWSSTLSRRLTKDGASYYIGSSTFILTSPTGVFAGAKLIPTGTFLGIYAGELMGTDLAETLGLSVQFLLRDTEFHAYIRSKYTAIKRTYVLDIDNWFLSDRFKPDSAEGFHVMPPAPPADPSEWEAEYCVDAFRVANVSILIFVKDRSTHLDSFSGHAL